MAEPQRLTNWAGNYKFSAQRVHRPRTVEEVQQIVQRCKKLRVLGTGHSFNGIADCDEDLISLEYMNQVLSIDHVKSTVAVEGGIKYGDLAVYLHTNGYGLHNLASLPHTTVAGAISTATHGSGDGNGNLAIAVAGMQVVNGRGEVVDLGRDANPHEFEGAVVSLGGLGVITKLTLDVVPTYEIRQDVYQKLSFNAVQENFEKIFSSAYSVSIFTDWKSSTFNQLWVKSRVEPGAKWVPAEAQKFGAILAKSDLHPIEGISPINCTLQMGIPGSWHDRLPHFRMDFTPSSGKELQAEYIIPRQNAAAAIRRIEALKEHIAPVVQTCEIRTIAADTLWMSPCYKQECVGIHFTLIPDWPSVSRVLPMVDQVLEPLQTRPHWGKVTTMPPERVRSMYCKLPEFRQLLESFDPQVMESAIELEMEDWVEDWENDVDEEGAMGLIDWEELNSNRWYSEVLTITFPHSNRDGVESIGGSPLVNGRKAFEM
ncbi:hypothetical protein R1sor_001543 [Riccia sorocarpa]|uniref:FAD-binding PCMH-type domain-containing protein n=1 Tax=Riccia sorocarpa TaxID=122646 RepID=A0ABD3GY67_9MARC